MKLRNTLDSFIREIHTIDRESLQLLANSNVLMSFNGEIEGKAFQGEISLGRSRENTIESQIDIQFDSSLDADLNIFSRKSIPSESVLNNLDLQASLRQIADTTILRTTLFDDFSIETNSHTGKQIYKYDFKKKEFELLK